MKEFIMNNNPLAMLFYVINEMDDRTASACVSKEGWEWLSKKEDERNN